MLYSLLVILWGHETKSLPLSTCLSLQSGKLPWAREQGKISLWRSYSICLLGRGQGKLGCPGEKQGDRESEGKEGSQWEGSESDNTPHRASMLFIFDRVLLLLYKSPFFWVKETWPARGSQIETTPGMWVTNLGTGCWAWWSLKASVTLERRI